MTKRVHSILIVLISAFFVPSCGTSKKATQPSTTSIKVMSYNIRLIKGKDGSNSWEYRKFATPAMLSDISPDVFGLQEAYPEQVQYILDNCPQYQGYGLGREDGVNGERTEVMWNSEKLEALDMGTFWLSETPDTPSISWDSKCSRTATWVLLKEIAGGKRFYMVNTHLDHVGWEARRLGLKVIEERIAAMNRDKLPMILTGDFNIRDDHEIIKEFNTRMNNSRLTSQTPVRDTGTFHNWGEYLKSGTRRVIDYIYYSGFSTCRSFDTVDKSYENVPYCSDHYPIFAVLEF